MAKLGKSLSKAQKHSTEDKMLEYYYKGTQYFENNKNRVYTVLTILIVIIAVVFIYFRNQSQKGETAALELSKVKQFYAMDMFPAAINGDSLGISKGLQYIVDNYGSTESGQTAKIMLANSYYNLREFDKADKYFRDYSGNNDLFKAAASVGIASVYETKGDWKNAADFYIKASKVSKTVPTNDEYLYYAIRSYYNAKDNENLTKAIRSFKTDYPKSKYLGMLARYESSEQS